MIPAHPHHVVIDPRELEGNGGAGRVCILPGSESRARRIADRFSDVRVFPSPRQINVYVGHMDWNGQRVELAAVATGMGCPSVNIVVTELFSLGARRFLRVGSAGSLQHGHVKVGDLVIATAAVRDEGTSDAFAPRDVPSVAHPDWILALREAALARGEGERSWLGPVHSKDCFYGREFPGGPLGDQNVAYMEMLRKVGTLATEMESSHLFLLGAVLNGGYAPVGRTLAGADVVKAGSVLAIIGDDQYFAPPEEARVAEDRAIDLGLEAACRLVDRERLG